MAAVMSPSLSPARIPATELAPCELSAIGRMLDLVIDVRREYQEGIRAGEPPYPQWTHDAVLICAFARQAQHALPIADEAARSDIECHCAWTSEDPAARWFDTSKIEDQDRELELRAMVDRSIAYLELRRLLVRHPENKALVRVKERA